MILRIINTRYCNLQPLLITCRHISDYRFLLGANRGKNRLAKATGVQNSRQPDEAIRMSRLLATLWNIFDTIVARAHVSNVPIAISRALTRPRFIGTFGGVIKAKSHTLSNFPTHCHRPRQMVLLPLDDELRESRLQENYVKVCLYIQYNNYNSF